MKKIFVSLLGLIVFFLVSCGGGEKEYVVHKHNKGYSGEAERNPYLVAQLFLEEYRYETEESGTARFDLEDYHAIVIPSSSIRTGSQVATMVRYVKEGGHVICLLEAGEKDYRDFGVNYWEIFDEMDPGPLNEFGEAFEVEFVQSEDAAYDFDGYEEMKEEARKYEIPNSEVINVEFRDGHFAARSGGEWEIFDVAEEEREAPVVREYYYYDDDVEAYAHSVIADKREYGHKILSKGYGDQNGRVTFIADGRMLRNPHFATQNHASILLGLLEKSESYKVLFTYGKSEGFYSLLARYYYYGLMGLILLVFFWLMSRWHRFGPILEPLYSAPVSYLKSLESRGHFYWKHKKGQYLIAGLQARAARVAGLENADTVSRQKKIKELAESLSVEFIEVEKAFAVDMQRDALSFINAVSILQKTIRYYE